MECVKVIELLVRSMTHSHLKERLDSIQNIIQANTMSLVCISKLVDMKVGKSGKEAYMIKVYCVKIKQFSKSEKRKQKSNIHELQRTHIFSKEGDSS